MVDVRTQPFDLQRPGATYRCTVRPPAQGRLEDQLNWLVVVVHVRVSGRATVHVWRDDPGKDLVLTPVAPGTGQTAELATDDFRALLPHVRIGLLPKYSISLVTSGPKPVSTDAGEPHFDTLRAAVTAAVHLSRRKPGAIFEVRETDPDGAWQPATRVVDGIEVRSQG